MDHDDGTKSSVRIIVAIIGAFAVITAAVLSHDDIMEMLLKRLRTKTVSIDAAREFSGSTIYLAGDDLLTFRETDTMVGAGDTNEDQLVKSFLSFYLGEIPPKARIVGGQIKIQCGVIGNPEVLGDLSLTEYGFGTYNQSVFYGAPNNTWKITCTDTTGLIRACRRGGKALLTGYPLDELVQNHSPGDWIQLVLQFEGNLIVDNQSIDALLLTGVPSLIVKYRLDPE